MPNTYLNRSDKDLIAELTRPSVNTPKASMALMALTDDSWFEAVSELRRRYNRRAVEAFATVQETMPTTPRGRVRHAGSVEIDPQRFRAFFFTRRLPLTEIGPMVGRSRGWASVIAFKGRGCIKALEEVARELDMPAEDLIYAIGSDVERERCGLL